ncbi:hypothetical protein F4677DRAFT_436849 [Hypoxylon crocopeplum]|nr:hypothetical protein F4677DRAFT_436849 [Hypoxylon crocopeplum]
MASITTRQGKICTAVPKIANIQLTSSTSTSTSTSTTSSSTSTSIPSSTTSSSTSTSTSISSSSSSSTSTSTVADAQPINAADPELPSEILPTVATTTPAAIPIAGPAVVETPLTSSTGPLATTTDNASSTVVTSLLLDTSSTPSPSQPNGQAQNSNGPADSSVTSTQSPTGQTDGSSISTSLAGDTAALTTGDAQPTGPALETETNGAGLPSSDKAVTGNAITTEQTIAIAVGVIGGVVVISLIAFIIWLWRKRKMQERRSTLLTPLSPGATFRPDEKGPYFISRTSVGPTPLSEKLWAVVGMKYRRLRGRVNDIVARSSSPTPSVNLDRGNSQYGSPDGVHSRNNSNAGAIVGSTTTKGRFVDWWGRLAEDGNFNWRLRHESKGDPISSDSLAGTRSPNESGRLKIGSQPDFLSLLGMDNKQLEREAARGRGSVSSNHQRRSISVGNEQHFLGGLGLNFDDPFSDVNAIGNSTTKATTPLAVSAVNNPFSDANAIRAPSTAVNGGLTTYVQNVRRSRGHSVHVAAGAVSRQASIAGDRMNSVYRESNASVDTIGTRRNKFRSDPFDLDRPDLFESANSSIVAVAGGASRASRSSRSVGGLPSTPQPAHMRSESFTSKYSSGISGMSMGEWSDPGPDVGPAAARFTPSPDSGIGRRDSDTRRSGSSQGSVGRAL